MKHKKGGKSKGHGKKINKAKLTDEELALLEAKLQEKLKEEHERKEKEKYDKYIGELREQNYRSALLSEPIKSILTMYNAHKKLRRSQKEIQKWNNYLSCSSLPNVRDPPSVRGFIYRWKREVLDDIKNFFSWVLDVDERSMLSQDLDKPNQCYWNLYNKQPVIGEHFVPRIEQCLTLLNELELVLRDTQEPDLLKIKQELRIQLRDTVDLFSFRILSNVERDMCRIDPSSANHNFKSNCFSSSLWSTRPVPQLSKNWRTDGVTEMCLSEIDATILLPNQVETDGFSYRGLLMNYDHFSDMARSSQLNITFPPTPDLRLSGEIEWNKREEMMHEKLDQMRSERAKYEQREEERALKEAEAKKKKPREVKKPGAPTVKKKKVKPGPMVVTETTVVDVTEDYLKYEEDLLTQQKIAMSPEALNLTEDEINLREFQIFGGVYAFHYLIRPNQYTQLKHQFLFKIDNRPILEYAEFVASEECDLIEIHVKLSDKVNWWFSPVACYWQKWEESDEFLALSPELQDFHINYDKYMARLNSLLFTEPQPKLNYDLVECINDFTLNKLPRNIDFVKLIHDYLVPRMPITFKFQIELDAEKEILRREALRKKEAEMERNETNQKRRAAFDNAMEEYLVTVQADVEETVTKMEIEFEEFYVAERVRLINHGENELQIERYMKRRREADEAKMRDVESDAMIKYKDYVEDQFKERVLAFEKVDKDVAVVTQCHVTKTSPRELFPTKPRQLPLKLINEDTVYSFDIPNEDDPLGCDEELNEDMLLSTFLRYLIILFEKNKPFFKELPKVEELETAPIVDDALSIILPAKPKTPQGKKKKKSKKPKTPNKSGNKLPKKGGKKPKAPKSSKQSSPNQSPKSATPKKSPGSAKSSKSSRSRSSKKTPRSAGSSKKTSKSPRKGSKKRRKQKKHPDEAETEIEHPEEITDLSHIHKKKSRKDKILNLVPHFPGKWVRGGINLLDFNIESREVKFQISRFGTFGFAMPKYSNFPLKYWELYPNAYKKHSVLLKIIGNYAEIKIEITDDGFLIERIDPNNINFVPHKTAIDYRELKNYLLDCGFNIFPDRDAAIYVQDISEKHRSMEEHTYYCAAQYTLSHYFRMSEFNRLVNYRASVFEMYEMRENVNIPDQFTQILVTPQKCNFVVPVEVTPKTGDKYIDFKLEPKEQEYYPDLFNMLLASCNEQSKKYHEQMKRVHRYNVARLLCAIRPLSFA